MQSKDYAKQVSDGNAHEASDEGVLVLIQHFKNRYLAGPCLDNE